MASRRPTAPRGRDRARSGGAASSAPGASRRPAAAPRPRTTPAPPVAEVPRGLTRRAAVLAVLLLAAAVVLAPYLRMLAEQQATISALETRVAEQAADVERLQGELARWEDPAFVQAQARERLFMVMPGETGYVVLDPPQAEEPEPQAAAAAEQALGVLGEDRPWFGTLWESVRLAGQQAPVPAPDGAAPSGPGRSVPAPPP